MEQTPLTAVTAEDPYPYYRSLTANHPFAYDDRISAWVAASARSVDAVLNNRALRVRPASEPVPNAIAGSILGEIFASMARMTDGPRHDALRAKVDGLVARIDLEQLTIVARSCAQRLANDLSSDDPQALTAFLYLMPASTMAIAVGLEPQPETLAAIRDFARAIAPGCSDADLERGIVAASELLQRWGRNDEPELAAARFGILFQTYDATAGLIGNTLVRLAIDARAANTKQRASNLDALLERTLHDDAPIQNTRRFAAKDTVVLEHVVRAGQTILVLLAAANHDRSGERTYTFGVGAHACAGAQVATTVARAAVDAVLAHNIDLAALRVGGYHPSINARIPVFAAAVAG
jgi:cytochrome P450